MGLLALRASLPDARAGADPQPRGRRQLRRGGRRRPLGGPARVLRPPPVRRAARRGGARDRARRGDRDRACDGRGHACELAIMDFGFMGGSMGSAVGEKFSRACDSAIEQHVPLVSVAASGGARMQEGILALMQLPKTIVRGRGPARRRLRADLRARPPDDRRRARELREPRRRPARGAGRADVLRRPARRPADHAREAARRLRPRRVELRFGHVDAIVPRARAEATSGGCSGSSPCRVKPSCVSASGLRS